MSKEDILYNRVVQLYNEIVEYSKKVTEKTKEERKSLTKDLIEKYKKSPESQEIKDFSFEVFVTNYIHKMDIGILQTKFMLFYDAYNLLEDTELEFEEDIRNLHSTLKTQQQNQTYTISKGKFEEIEKGTVDKIKKNFVDNNTFERLREDLELYMNG